MNASPRDLDPKFKTVEADPATSSDKRPDEGIPQEEVPMIVHNEKYFEGSVQHTREHRVPLAEWATYEKEHGF